MYGRVWTCVNAGARAAAVLGAAGPAIISQRRVGTFHYQHSHYTVLNLDVEASAADIKKAYLQLAQELHPDRNPDKGAVLSFQAAKEVRACVRACACA